MGLAQLKQWLGLEPDHVKTQAAEVYLGLVARARQPFFYTDLAVPDTLDGRFELVVLHVALVIDYLYEQDTKADKALADALFEHMFDDFDRSLREMGIGDLGIGKRVRKMGEAFYGRAKAYRDALRGSKQKVMHALDRNLYGTKTISIDIAERMADYVLAFQQKLKTTPHEVIKGVPHG